MQKMGMLWMGVMMAVCCAALPATVLILAVVSPWIAVSAGVVLVAGFFLIRRRFGPRMRC